MTLKRYQFSREQHFKTPGKGRRNKRVNYRCLKLNPLTLTRLPQALPRWENILWPGFITDLTCMKHQ